MSDNDPQKDDPRVKIFKSNEELIDFILPVADKSKQEKTNQVNIENKPSEIMCAELKIAKIGEIKCQQM